MQIQTPGLIFRTNYHPPVLDDSNHWWYDATDLDTITKNGSNYVSQWNAKGGAASGKNLLQATGINQPLWRAEGTIRFDGINDFLKSEAFTWSQPAMIYILFKNLSFAANEGIIDSYSGTSYKMGQLAEDGVFIYAGSTSISVSVGVNEFVIVRALYNGVSSKIIRNNETPVTGNIGTDPFGGMTVGARFSPSDYSNIEIQTIVCANITDVANETEIYNWLLTRMPGYPGVLNDGNTIAYYDPTDLSTITKDGSNLVSRWNDKLGSGRDLIQSTSANQPLWVSPDYIRFDGIDNYLKTASFTWIQPMTVYILFRSITWTNWDQIFDGLSNYNMYLYQGSTTPGLKVAAPTSSTQNNNLAVNTWGIARCLFNGTNSKFIIDNTTEIAENFGTNPAGGFTLGSRADGTSLFARVDVACIILRKDDISFNSDIYNFLVNRIPV